MSERDKLIAQADRLEGVRGTIVLHDMDPAAIIAHLDALIEPIRALAAQQPEAVEPVEEPVAWLITWEKSGRQIASLDPCHEDDGSCVPLYTHPQVSAPTDHTAADAPAINPRGQGNNNPEAILNTSSGSAVGVTPDLDALVAALGYQKQIDEDGTFVGVSRQAVCEAAKAIADLRAQKNTWKALAEDWSAAADAAQQPEKFYEEYDEKSMRAMQALLAKANARITRLEAENAEARELLRWWSEKQFPLTATLDYLAKQGD